MTNSMESAFAVLQADVWALTQNGLEQLAAEVALRFELRSLAGPTTRATAPQTQRRGAGTVGVIQIRGTLTQHASRDFSSLLTMFSQKTTIDEVSAQLKQLLADSSVVGIVLDIDSPGGSHAGVSELASEIIAGRSKKPILAIANAEASSAATWIGVACQRFYCTPSGFVGGIGITAMHQDVSKMADKLGVRTTFVSAGKFKTGGNQFEPLGDDTRRRIQARVDDVYNLMVQDIARGRGVSAETVRKRYGEGDVLTARQATAAGLVDGAKTLDQVIAEARTARPAPTQGGAMAMSAEQRLRQFRFRAAMSASSLPAPSGGAVVHPPAAAAPRLLRDPVYVELLNAEVNQRIRILATSAARMACEELGLEIRVPRWFRQATPEQKRAIEKGSTDYHVLPQQAGPVMGMVIGWDIWVLADQSDQEAFMTAAHEVRHLWQRDVASVALDEADASRYERNLIRRRWRGVHHE